jgi:cell division initiation protein
MSITPLDIQQQRFRSGLRGYDTRQVDAYLEQLVGAFETLQRENQELAEENRRLLREINGYRDREEAFKRALINSQKVMDQMKANARRQSELIVAEAEVNAEKLLSRAHNRLAQLQEEITELKRQRIQLETQLRSIIDSHSRLLKVGSETRREMDREDEKLTLLKTSK